MHQISKSSKKRRKIPGSIKLMRRALERKRRKRGFWWVFKCSTNEGYIFGS